MHKKKQNASTEKVSFRVFKNIKKVNTNFLMYIFQNVH